MIYVLSTKDEFKYPYTKEMLKGSYPNTSFPELITDELAKDFGCYPVTPTDRPAYDPRTQKTEELDPSWSDSEWKQVWTVRDATPEEIEAYDAENAPEPEWSKFKYTLLTDSAINEKLAEGMSLAPAAVLGIVPSLLNVENGKFDDFRAAWLALRRSGVLTAEMASSVASVASECHLPSDFIRVLR